jgi:SMODS-associated and fused to various effectors sensor domain
MAKAVAARMQGDDYQARWFWVQVCRLFEDRTKVIRVAYEKDNVKSFDDVAVFYRDGMFDEDGYPLSADYFQVKFHVTAAGAFTWQVMMDPAFVNASSISILQRLKNAQQQYAPGGRGCRFFLFSPWRVHPDDPLAAIHSQTDGRILWPKLADGRHKSKMARVRTAWREHLGIATDEELQIILRPLRILEGGTLVQLRNLLNLSLQLAGLIPVSEGAISHPYDALIHKLLQIGRTEFTRNEIEVICKQENLWEGHSMREPDAYRVGIRSFLRWTEYLEDETDSLLSLLQYFEGRQIKSPDLWQSHIFPEVNTFIYRTFRGRERYHIHLHAHLSIAFAAGYCLDPKAGADVALVQSNLSGRQIWRPDSSQTSSAYPTWTFSDQPTSSNGSDVALALSVTHNILKDVSAYVGQSLPQVRRIISCTPQGGPGPQAIADGTHTQLLASQLAAFLKDQRTGEERRGKLHIFAAAPNVLLFFLGRLGQGLGPCTLYEYDFESNALGAYQPSLTFPPP